MAGGERRVKVTKDIVGRVLTDLQRLTGKEVLVGIPETTTSRGESEVTNAMIGYWMEFGAPRANVPARPSLIPGVRKSGPRVVPHLIAACTAALDGKREEVDKQLTAAGMVAASSVKQVIRSGPFVPLKPATVAARARARGAKSRRDAETEYLKLIAGGAAPDAAQAAAGIKPLINSGEFIGSITSVVRKRKKT